MKELIEVEEFRRSENSFIALWLWLEKITSIQSGRRQRDRNELGQLMINHFENKNPPYFFIHYLTGMTCDADCTRERLQHITIKPIPLPPFFTI